MIRNTLTYMRAYLGKHIKNEKGQTMVEYAVIIALIAVALFIALGDLEGGIKATFDEITEKLGGAITE